MTPTTHRRKSHLKDTLPPDPAVRRFGEWSWANRNFYQHFLDWLADSHYSPSARNLYGVAARQAMGYLDRPYWTLDPEVDLHTVWEHLQTRPLQPSTLADYHKGLLKFAEYLRLRLRRPALDRPLHWEHYLGSLPDWLSRELRGYLVVRARAWKLDRRREHAQDTLSHLTQFLRWLAARDRLTTLADLTPTQWYDYQDERLAAGRSPVTLNGELTELQQFLYYLRDDQSRPVCERLFLVRRLGGSHRLPKDVPVERLRLLLTEIQAEAVASHAGKRRMGRMDLAWFLLMLHSGLRTGEVRSLRLGEVDLGQRRVRIEQSKGLKDRLVYLSEAGAAALASYLAMRGPREALPEQVFIYAHKPLSSSYCSKRLLTYGKRCGVRVTPHQLRHSCATLLLNAGTPVVTVQLLLGHKWIDTTLGYARVYDGTLAADYYRAMNEVERQLELVERMPLDAPSLGELVALVDSLCSGTLNKSQASAVQSLRDGLLALARQETA